MNKYLLIIAYLFLSIHSIGQISTSLQVNSTLTGNIQASEKHTYTIQSAADQFILGAAIQETVDLVVTIKDPDGKVIRTFDSPARGPETFQFTTEAAGSYQLIITPFEEGTGNYSLELWKHEALASDREQKIDQIMALYDLPQSPGAALAVIQNGETVFSKNYGLANVEHAIPITSSSIFDIASVSKQFGAFAIALLVDQGKLSLDDDIRTHIPEVPDFGNTITIRHLVHHMSGIRDWPGNLAIGGWRMDDVISFEQILNMVEHQRSLNFIPGYEYLYSNTGYNLLAETVKRVTGQSFREWTDENIFKPLGMTSTHFQDDHTEVIENKVYGYSPGQNGLSQTANGLTALGSSSLFTTIEDLAKWIDNFDQMKLGSPDVHKLIHQQGVLNNGEQIAYAFGQSINQYKGIKRVVHSGSWAGFRTYLARFPEQSTSVVLLSNKGNANPSADALAVVDLYLELDDQEKPATLVMVEETPVKENSEETISVDPGLLKAYAGKYLIEGGPAVEIIHESDILKVQLQGQQAFVLLPLSDSLFKVDIPGIDASVAFHLNHEGLADRATLFQNGQTEMRRMDPWDPDKDEMTNYTGSYYSPELMTTYTMTLADEQQLVASHIRNSDIRLNIIEKDRFRGNTWFFNQIQFLRDDNDQINGFEVSNGRVRNVFFEKVGM